MTYMKFQLQAGFSHLHCINQTAETVYLNRIDVKRAIHVNEDFVSQWTPCSETVSGLYQYSNKSYLSNITQLAQVILARVIIIQCLTSSYRKLVLLLLPVPRIWFSII